MSGADMPAPGQRVVLGPTGASRDAVVAFAEAYDPQPFHLSDTAAAATYFGRLSASGWHTLAMALDVIARRLPWTTGPGGLRDIRDLRWQHPVYPDDTLWIEVTMGKGAARNARIMNVRVLNQAERIVARFEARFEVDEGTMGKGD